MIKKQTTINDNKEIDINNSKNGNNKRILTIVFITLLIDLFAFTVILPIFPNLIHYYQIKEGESKDTILSKFLRLAYYFRTEILRHHSTDSRLETTLLGGCIGSFFSLIQFLVSPTLGRLADRYGRRITLLISVFGNLASSLVWALAKDFPVFLLARWLAGISEANVQIANAIVADVTTSENRAKGMALIGIAFSIAFTVGPALSGYLVSKNMFQNLLKDIDSLTHPFTSAALLACLLILIEILLLYFFLPETKDYSIDKTRARSNEDTQPFSIETKNQLKSINWLHLCFLFLFSGMEFTLPFLGYDMYGFGYVEQGRMFGYLGILSTLIQGGYVRRYSAKVGEAKIVTQGILSCVIGLVILSFVIAYDLSLVYLYLAITFLAFTSATVVSSLSSLTSLVSEPKKDSIPSRRAEILGTFRSFGQLGRAIGPLVACSIYWGLGGAACYALGAVALMIVLIGFHGVLFKAGEGRRVKVD